MKDIQFELSNLKSRITKAYKDIAFMKDYFTNKVHWTLADWTLEDMNECRQVYDEIMKLDETDKENLDMYDEMVESVEVYRDTMAEYFDSNFPDADTPWRKDDEHIRA